MIFAFLNKNVNSCCCFVCVKKLKSRFVIGASVSLPAACRLVKILLELGEQLVLFAHVNLAGDLLATSTLLLAQLLDRLDASHVRRGRVRSRRRRCRCRCRRRRRRELRIGVEIDGRVGQGRRHVGVLLLVERRDGLRDGRLRRGPTRLVHLGFHLLLTLALEIGLLSQYALLQDTRDALARQLGGKVKVKVTYSLFLLDQLLLVLLEGEHGRARASCRTRRRRR